mgnify:CR=1 FL=1
MVKGLDVLAAYFARDEACHVLIGVDAIDLVLLLARLRACIAVEA